jgi:hypothetical protein
MKAPKACGATERWPCVFAHELPPSALGKRCAMAPRKRALAMLRQPCGPIKTKRVWFNETGAGVVLAHLGRGVRPRYGRGRAFPSASLQQPILGDDHARCGGLGRGLRTRHAQGPCRRRPLAGSMITVGCDPAAAPDPLRRARVSSTLGETAPRSPSGDRQSIGLTRVDRAPIRLFVGAATVRPTLRWGVHFRSLPAYVAVPPRAGRAAYRGMGNFSSGFLWSVC